MHWRGYLITWDIICCKRDIFPKEKRDKIHLGLYYNQGGLKVYSILGFRQPYLLFDEAFIPSPPPKKNKRKDSCLYPRKTSQVAIVTSCSCL